MSSCVLVAVSLCVACDSCCACDRPGDRAGHVGLSQSGGLGQDAQQTGDRGGQVSWGGP